MQAHLKERLTGAALLVLAVVLLVPEMFRGRPVIAPQSASAVPGEMPLRSYTIDLRDNEVAQPLPAGAPLIAGAPQAAAAPPVIAAPAPKPARSAAPGWTVQVGSFARRDYAERMVKQIKAKGFATQVAGPDDRGLYRVRSVRFAERSSALDLRDQMRGKGLKPIVNALP